MPYVPPTKEYISLEQMVERFPNWGYQLHFREKSTNAEIEKHVSIDYCVPGYPRVSDVACWRSSPSSSS